MCIVNFIKKLSFVISNHIIWSIPEKNCICNDEENIKEIWKIFLKHPFNTSAYIFINLQNYLFSLSFSKTSQYKSLGNKIQIIYSKRQYS